jgi:hypothetical protein
VPWGKTKGATVVTIAPVSRRLEKDCSSVLANAYIDYRPRGDKTLELFKYD